MTGYFLQAFIYLVAAVIAVPIAKRLGLGSVLGYLIAGVVIGPIIGLVGEETTTIQHFAEFGVVMMLFLVGLELEPKMLWAMRNRLMGLGGLQVGGTTAIVMGIALFFGQPWTIALTIGLIFALSSTAIVLQTFNEKGLSKTEGGKNAFSVLLFQDIAVIPMLAFIPLLALPELIEAAQSAVASASDHHEELSLVAGLPGWAYGLVITASIAIVVVGGHFLSRPLFRFVASSGLREIFTATALMLVIGIAALMSLVGLSPALGTFLAGVVLANSEFRHELESNIDPFKGLLLGLFFITVGAGINFDVLFNDFGLIIGLTLGVMLLKALVLFTLALIFKIKNSDRWLFTLSLAQAGEFGFVLLSFSAQNHVLPADIVQTLSLVVALSMFLTPGLFILFDKVILPRYEQKSNDREEDTIEEKGTVIIAGIGRFGQIVNRLLVSNDVNTVVLDHQANQVDLLRSINIKSYFGDATRHDLLHTAGIEEAAMLVVAIDNQDSSVELVKYVKHTYPKVKILARAFDRGHSYRLREAGADFVESETYHSALEMGAQALRSLGHHPFFVEQQKSTYQRVESRKSEKLYQAWSEAEENPRYDNNYRQIFIHLEDAMKEDMKKDRSDKHSRSERGWTPPPKGYADGFEEEES
ncbi:Kef-type potassium/proton antiporter (CPA2 family) [Vibrio crassostreae]|jgi:CPA2 family monovalent cation:H+ antiporter-2/glutathione-regulated potassium-efflux system ancillary protein KefC|uniref:monovalent cation:proton antiporter-2 (CPA2) family protein n=1 Tax=Vibrio crassostreae TaxID=246167 RepID=UPI000F4870BA|nr:monovalent cation:proton antiporter-2 (CPA2) family protein [Vibrio crassostreae]ROO70179.1 Kef-type potassium/proton antiporter (CPA2 family) [Vibrio crassostreae]ROP08893.1 Kef-type potassium/proton antiporter (CPA2 family) [Vibrio crassostreae]ROQ75245.1 Kef-type potassium/proton antiporter (CPA2 family) [Vibrio crassostreae]ROR79619.1 Kef-type potassium/proton antiporter (CPA2 family) [Vibrio crassostreae]RPE91693.1 Kef-type potassium/proton antiporter (CPA2 family) [Vibrio crassostreae